MNKISHYEMGEFHRISKDINDRHEYLLKQATPIAIKQTLDAVAALARTKVIAYMKGKAKVPRWAIARKMPKKLQQKAKLAEWRKSGKMSAKNHFLTGGITYASLFGKAKDPRPSDAKMKALQKRKGGVKAPGRSKDKDAFVADGARRVNDPSYEKRLRRNTSAGPPVLKGKHYQVMKRTGKQAYPVEVLKVDIERDARRAMDSFVKRIYNTRYIEIFERQLAYNMTHKVKF